VTLSDHYSDEDWADFARNITDSDRRTSMQRHLEQGCPVCAELHDRLRAVQTIAAADGQYEPPAGTVRQAKALYEFNASAGPFARALETVKLLFDSQFAPLPAGVRSSRGGPRKLLFASGDLVINLEIATARTPQHTEIIGEVTAPSHLSARRVSQPVVLTRKGLSVANTATNKRGEFQLEFAGAIDDLTLTIGAERHVTVITLGTLTRT
jgi:hypothetical protein